MTTTPWAQAGRPFMVKVQLLYTAVCLHSRTNLPPGWHYNGLVLDFRPRPEPPALAPGTWPNILGANNAANCGFKSAKQCMRPCRNACPAVLGVHIPSGEACVAPARTAPGMDPRKEPRSTFILFLLLLLQ
eukprot:scaffold594_cov116-Isochrysis_galbana.AAC.2